MKVKVFATDKNGNIHFTKKELQDLLDEVYREGYEDARPHYYYWTTPYYWTNTNPYYMTTCSTTGTSAVSNSTNTTLNDSITATSGSVLKVGEAPEPAKYEIKFLNNES